MRTWNYQLLVTAEGFCEEFTATLAYCVENVPVPICPKQAVGEESALHPQVDLQRF
jgi:hypothetical protein